MVNGRKKSSNFKPNSTVILKKGKRKNKPSFVVFNVCLNWWKRIAGRFSWRQLPPLWSHHQEDLVLPFSNSRKSPWLLGLNMEIYSIFLVSQMLLTTQTELLLPLKRFPHPTFLLCPLIIGYRLIVGLLYQSALAHLAHKSSSCLEHDLVSPSLCRPQPGVINSGQSSPLLIHNNKPPLETRGWRMKDKGQNTILSCPSCFYLYVFVYAKNILWLGRLLLLHITLDVNLRYVSAQSEKKQRFLL